MSAAALFRALWLCAGMMVLASAAAAQDSGDQGSTSGDSGPVQSEAMADEAAVVPQPLLTLNETEFFEKSDWGQAAIRAAEAAAAALSTENRAIEASLEEEERSLTEKRSQMSASEFSALATAFDARVEEFRQTQDAKSRAMNRKLDEDRKVFIEQARPLLVELLAEYDAVAIIADDSLILSRASADVTQRAIDLINQRLPAPAVLPDAPEPAPVPSPEPAPAPAPAP